MAMEFTRMAVAAGSTAKINEYIKLELSGAWEPPSSLSTPGGDCL